MAVAVAYVDASGNVMVLRHGRSPSSCADPRFGSTTLLYACHRGLRAEHNLGLCHPIWTGGERRRGRGGYVARPQPGGGGGHKDRRPPTPRRSLCSSCVSAEWRSLSIACQRDGDADIKQQDLDRGCAERRVGSTCGSLCLSRSLKLHLADHRPSSCYPDSSYGYQPWSLS